MWDCLDVPFVFIFPERRRDTLMTVMHHLDIVIQYEWMHICKYLAVPHVCNAWYYMWWIGSASLEFHAMNLNFEVRSLHINCAVLVRHSCGAGKKWNVWRRRHFFAFFLILYLQVCVFQFTQMTVSHPGI